MNAVNKNEVSLKVAVCAAAALALTVLSGWSFVESTANVRGAAAVAQQETPSLGEILIVASRTLAQNESENLGEVLIIGSRTVAQN
jgi:hypothetical protein